MVGGKGWQTHQDFLPPPPPPIVIYEVTLSLGLVSTPIPSFSGIRKVMKFY